MEMLGMQKGFRTDDDRALSDKEICAFFKFSKMTLKRYREKHGLPGPSFRVGPQPYTYASKIDAWLKEREAAGVEFQLATHIMGRTPAGQPGA
jgi:hypothetical protein